MEVPFEILKGKTLRNVYLSWYYPGYCIEGRQKNMIIFEVSDDEKYQMLHHPDCCEDVFIEDICGELDWLSGEPILRAEKRTNKDNKKALRREYDSWTWTFYEISTIKGSVTIRWYGCSNGYYSEEVNFERIPISASPCFGRTH